MTQAVSLGNWQDDPYAVLGIKPDATPEEVHRAYRRVSASAHPDRGGSHQAMIAATAAWETLRDPARRAAYDRKRSRPTDEATLAQWEGAAWKARSAAETYPRKWAEFQKWLLGAVAKDITDATYEWTRPDPSPAWYARTPGVSLPGDSISGLLLGLVGAGAAAAIYVWLFWHRFLHPAGSREALETFGLVRNVVLVAFVGWAAGVGVHMGLRQFLRYAALSPAERQAGRVERRAKRLSELAGRPVATTWDRLKLAGGVLGTVGCLTIVLPIVVAFFALAVFLWNNQEHDGNERQLAIEEAHESRTRPDPQQYFDQIMGRNTASPTSKASAARSAQRGVGTSAGGSPELKRQRLEDFSHFMRAFSDTVSAGLSKQLGSAGHVEGEVVRAGLLNTDQSDTPLVCEVVTCFQTVLTNGNVVTKEVYLTLQSESKEGKWQILKASKRVARDLLPDDQMPLGVERVEDPAAWQRIFDALQP